MCYAKSDILFLISACKIQFSRNKRRIYWRRDSQKGTPGSRKQTTMFHKGKEEGGASEWRPGKFRASCPSVFNPLNTSFPRQAILSPTTSLLLPNHRNSLFIHIKPSENACQVVSHMKKQICIMVREWRKYSRPVCLRKRICLNTSLTVFL